MDNLNTITIIHLKEGIRVKQKPTIYNTVSTLFTVDTITIAISDKEIGKEQIVDLRECKDVYETLEYLGGNKDIGNREVTSIHVGCTGHVFINSATYEGNTHVNFYHTIAHVTHGLFTEGIVRLELSTTKGNTTTNIVEAFDDVHTVLDYLEANTDIGDREVTSIQVDNKGNVTISSKL